MPQASTQNVPTCKFQVSHRYRNGHAISIMCQSPRCWLQRFSCCTAQHLTICFSWQTPRGQAKTTVTEHGISLTDSYRQISLSPGSLLVSLSSQQQPGNAILATLICNLTDCNITLHVIHTGICFNLMQFRILSNIYLHTIPTVWRNQQAKERNDVIE